MSKSKIVPRNNRSKTRRNQDSIVWTITVLLHKVRKLRGTRKNLTKNTANSMNVGEIEQMIMPLQEKLGSLNRQDEIYVEDLPTVSFDLTTNRYNSADEIELELLTMDASIPSKKRKNSGLKHILDYVRNPANIHVTKK